MADGADKIEHHGTGHRARLRKRLNLELCIGSILPLSPATFTTLFFPCPRVLA